MAKTSMNTYSIEVLIFAKDHVALRFTRKDRSDLALFTTGDQEIDLEQQHRAIALFVGESKLPLNKKKVQDYMEPFMAHIAVPGYDCQHWLTMALEMWQTFGYLTPGEYQRTVKKIGKELEIRQGTTRQSSFALRPTMCRLDPFAWCIQKADIDSNARDASWLQV